MFNKIRDSINKLLRIQRGTGNQYFTHDTKETLFETKAFFNKYVRLITGLLIAIACVSYAFVRLVQILIETFLNPFLVNLKSTIGDRIFNFASLITYLLMFIIVYAFAWMVVRKLTSSIEVPQEERAKRCPMCGEQILEIAIKCKHCGSTVGRERTQSYQSGHRENYPKRDVRNSNTRIRPPIQQSRREQPRGGPHGGEQGGSHEYSRRRPSPYHARTKDGRYHSRYDQPRNYQQRNEHPQREESPRQENPSNNQPTHNAS